MPRHLISDAHEWINEIPTVPIYYLAKPQPRERAWQNQRGKKTLTELYGVYSCHRPPRGGPRGGDDAPSGATPRDVHDGEGYPAHCGVATPYSSRYGRPESNA